MTETPTMPSLDLSTRRILAITWPVLVTQMSFTAMGVIDTMMVGRLGVDALAAVGLGAFLSFWPLSFFFGLVTGLNTIVAQAVGAGREPTAGRALWQGLYLALASGAASAALAPTVPTLLALTGAEPAVRGLASGYIEVRLVGAVALMIFLVGDNFYRGIGATRLPMVCALAQLGLNCGFNYALIYGRLGAPELGVAGAAWGTTIAQLLVGLALVGSIPLQKRRFAGYRVLAGWRFERGIFADLVTVSLPIGVQTFMEMGGITVFFAAVARLGAAELAATNAVIQAWSAGFMGAFALSVATTTLVGQAMGAGQPESGRIVVRRVLVLGNGLAAVLGAIYVLFPAALMAAFVQAADLPELVPFAAPLFLVAAVCLVFDVRFNVFYGALRGAGDTRFPMLVNIGSAWLLFVPATLLAVEVGGLVGAWSCLVLHMAVMAVVLQVRFAGTAWMRRAVLARSAAGDSESAEPREPPPPRTVEAVAGE